EDVRKIDESGGGGGGVGCSAERCGEDDLKGFRCRVAARRARKEEARARTARVAASRRWEHRAGRGSSRPEKGFAMMRMRRAVSVAGMAMLALAVRARAPVVITAVPWVPPP